MKKIFSSIIILCIIFALLPIAALAGASGSASASEVETGRNVTVKFSFSYDTEIGGVQGNISYDTSKLKYVSSSGTLGETKANIPEGGTIIFTSIIGSASDASKSCSFSVTFTALAVGSTTVRLNETVISDMDYNSLGSPSTSVEINIKAKAEEKLSSDCNLKALQPPAGCTLEPKFSSAVTEYSCTVPYSVEKFPLEPAKSDSKAKIEYIGNVALKVGDNSRSVKVTAQDGTTKTYTVKIKRLSEAESPAITPAPTADVPQESNIIVTVNGKEMVLAGNISSQIPDKFTVEPFDYEGTEIQSAVLGSVRLVELADGEECGLYIFDKETKLFEKYISYTSSSTVYTVLSTTDKDVSMLEKTSVSLDENTEITAWLAPQVGEGYYIISVLNNENGEKYLALYCTEDKSIQKLSDKILGSVPASAETEIEQTDKNNKFSISKDIIKNIVIVFCSLVIVAGITVIIIVIIKNTKKKKRQHDWYDESDPYDVNIEEENIEIYTGHDSDFE